MQLQLHGAGIAGSCGSWCPCSGAGSKTSTFGSKGKETLPSKREKYEVLTCFRRRNALPACKMICKQENLWYLGIELLIRGVICSVPFPAGARDAVRGKTSPEGTCKSLPVLQVCFLLSPDIPQVNSPPR